ncbi:thermonuclease family protein [Methylocystis silviterrae]|uniref:thermonuclease family protein n=1 Tax=Methylocystis silviterrae TaxID=2743612 RepID=UPI001E5952A8|nr:thermonuclease family protein [Methylocystis silviterrae]
MDRRIRLHGVDAPEKGQPCFDAANPTYRCGQKAAMALDEFIGQSPVSCRERDVDRYGRTVADCRVRGEDIELWLVRSGHAFAYRRYSSDYIGAEQEAGTIVAVYGQDICRRLGNGAKSNATPFDSLGCGFTSSSAAAREPPHRGLTAARFADVGKLADARCAEASPAERSAFVRQIYFLETFVLSSAARRATASLTASSCAQKCT